MISRIVFFVSTIFFSISIFGQSNGNISNINQDELATSKLSIKANLLPLFYKGFGFSFETKIFNNLAAELGVAITARENVELTDTLSPSFIKPIFFDQPIYLNMVKKTSLEKHII